MHFSLQKYTRVFLHAVPSLIAIMLLEVVNIQVYLHGPVSKSPLILLGWLVLQMVPGFAFGYLSDCHFRKKILIWAQLLGLFGGSILLLFGFKVWVLVLVALTFNPMPVARAAFLDNFPQHSMLKLLAITFLAQYIPWVFYNKFALFPYETIIYWILGFLALNSLFTALWFQDNYVKHARKHKSLFSIKYKTPILLTLLAFTLSETTFYVLWTFLEETPELQSWQAITNYVTLIGIGLSMLYKRLPHISSITLFYSIGGGVAAAILIRCLMFQTSCDVNYTTAMSYFCVVGGLYLPFVTVAVIDMLGTEYKAVGSATIEFGDTIASFIAPLIALAVAENVFPIVIITLVLYICAALLQRRTEKIMHFE